MRKVTIIWVSLALTGGKTTDAATFDEQQGLVARAAWLAVNRDDVKWLVNSDFTHVFKVGDVAPGPVSPNTVSLNAGPELAVDGSRPVDTGLLDARHVTEFGLETALNLGRMFGQGGWFHYGIERRSAFPDPSFHGWYAMAAWSLTGESRPMIRRFPPAFTAWSRKLRSTRMVLAPGEVVARYSNMDLDYQPMGRCNGRWESRAEVQNIWSAGLNWYPNTKRFASCWTMTIFR